MTTEDLAAALATACRAARAGGAVARGSFGRALAAREKRGDDLLTEADLAAEATILVVLRAAHPEFGIVSEERGAVGGGEGYTWLVDPLDGTNNFVCGIPQFGVSIALLQGEEAVLGAIYQPMTDVLWEARRGAGARRDGAPIRAATRVDPRRAVVAAVQGYPVGDEVAAAVGGALRGQVKRVLTNWAPALDWCLLAEGRIAALVSLDSEHEDQVAGTLIAREAGALVTDLAGGPHTPAHGRILAAGRPAVHAHLRPLLAGVVQ